MTHYDTLIIGAGHNGLTAGALLAQAGQRVLILERRATPGGIAATEEILPGIRANTGWPGAPLLHPDVIRKLDLQQHGLNIAETAAHIFAPAKNGPPLMLWRDAPTSADCLKQISPRDADRYPDFLAFVRHKAGVLAAIMPLTPPDVKGPLSVRELFPWAKVALQVRGLGKREMMEFLRILPMSAHEFLSEWFESEALGGALGVFSTLGAHLGPMGAGTTLNLLYQFSGRAGPGFVRGGTGGVAAALMKAAESLGAEIRLGTGVRQVVVENGRATGVVTTSGERFTAPVVVSSADPRHTYLDLVGAHHLPVEVVRRVRNIRFRGTTATVHLVLRDLPDFGQATPDQLTGLIAICPSLMYLERAYDDAKYGRFSRRPALLAHIPTLQSDGFAPTETTVMSVMVRYAPYRLREGGWDAQKSTLEKTVIDTLAEYAPNLPDILQRTHTITPLDYEREYGLTEGAWMHGQMGLDQLVFMRPIPGWGRYRTPIGGLYLCGSGNHPGGGVSGIPGMNAAREILIMPSPSPPSRRPQAQHIPRL